MIDKFKITCGNNNPVHRDQLIRDMIYVGCLPQFSGKNRREFINISIAWSFSDRYADDINHMAKYKGCKYWSAGARQILESEGKFNNKDLRHEHVVPRKIFIDAMLVYFETVRINLEKKKNDEEVKRYLSEVFDKLKNAMERLLIGCVVTTEELEIIEGDGNKSDMPNHAYKRNNKPSDAEEKFFEITDRWARYKNEDGTYKTGVYELDWKLEKNRWNLVKVRKMTDNA